MNDIRSLLGLFRPACIQKHFFKDISVELRIIYKKKSKLNILPSHQSRGLDGPMVDETIVFGGQDMARAEIRSVGKIATCMFMLQSPVSSGEWRMRATLSKKGKRL